MCVLVYQESRSRPERLPRGGYRAWIGEIPRGDPRTHQKKAKCLPSVFMLVVAVFFVTKVFPFVWPGCEMGVQGERVFSQVHGSCC